MSSMLVKIKEKKKNVCISAFLQGLLSLYYMGHSTELMERSWEKNTNFFFFMFVYPRYIFLVIMQLILIPKHYNI